MIRADTFIHVYGGRVYAVEVSGRHGPKGDPVWRVVAIDGVPTDLDEWWTHLSGGGHKALRDAAAAWLLCQTH